MRTDGGRTGPRPVSYREALTALWTAQPTLPIAKARAATGAPKKVAEHVYKQLRAAGVVQPRRIRGDMLDGVPT